MGLFLTTWGDATKTYQLLYMNFYHKTNLFSGLSAGISMVGLFVSSIFYAQLADRLEGKYIKIKPYIIAF